MSLLILEQMTTRSDIALLNQLYSDIPLGLPNDQVLKLAKAGAPGASDEFILIYYACLTESPPKGEN